MHPPHVPPLLGRQTLRYTRLLRQARTDSTDTTTTAPPPPRPLATGSTTPGGLPKLWHGGSAATGRLIIEGRDGLQSAYGQQPHRGVSVRGARTDGATAALIKQAKPSSCDQLERLVTRLQSENWTFGEHSLTVLVSFAARVRHFALAKRLRRRLREITRSASGETYNTFLYLAAVQGSVVDAKRLWEEMRAASKLSSRSYVNAMLLHRGLRRPDNAVRAYLVLRASDHAVTPSATTLCITCCVALLKSGPPPEALTAHMREAGFADTTAHPTHADSADMLESFALAEGARHDPPWDTQLCVALLSLYSVCEERRCGGGGGGGRDFMRVAMPVLQQAHDRQAVPLWTAIITHYARCPDTRGFATALLMLKRGVHLSDMDLVCFGAILTACASVIRSATSQRTTDTCLRETDWVLQQACRTRCDGVRALHSKAASVFWEKLFRVYDAAGAVAKARQALAMILEGGGTPTPEVEMLLRRIEADAAREEEGGPEVQGSSHIAETLGPGKKQQYVIL